MNIGYINTMTTNLVALYYTENNVRLSASTLRGNIGEISKLALKGLEDSNAVVREAAKKLIDVLQGEGVSLDTANAPSIPDSTSATPPARDIGKTEDPKTTEDWEKLMKILVDVLGPMGKKIAQKIKTENPQDTPRACKDKFKAFIDAGEIEKIYSRYRGS